MKKLAILIFVLGMMCGVCSCGKKVPEWLTQYRMIDGGVEIFTTNCEGLKKVKIPSRIEGKPVIKISSYAFKNCTLLEEISLPNSLEVIEANAFENCTGLKKMFITKNVTDIAAHAFIGCKFQSVKVDKRNKVFTSKDMNGKECNSIIEVDGSDRVLRYTTKPYVLEGITELGDFSFGGVERIEQLVIPVGVEKVSRCAFAGCDIDTIYVEPENKNYTSRDETGKECNAIIAREMIKLQGESIEGNSLVVGSNQTTIPETVQYIDDYAFAGRKDLQVFHVPDTVLGIGVNVFQGCTGLTSVNFHENMEIDDFFSNACFKGCTQLKEVTLPKTMQKLGYEFFFGCSSLEEIHLPEGLIEIGAEAFAECSSLKSVVIPVGVTELPHSVFMECISLESVMINSMVKKISFDAFAGCSSLKNIDLSGVQEIGIGAFEGCVSLEDVVLGQALSTMGSSVFQGCTSLREVQLPDKISEIKAWAFGNCLALEEITIPKNVKAIENFAFEGCENLKEITIPESVETMESYVFIGCENVCIITTKGSYAEAWAKEHGIPCVSE